jgi:hypothetical protein
VCSCSNCDFRGTRQLDLDVQSLCYKSYLNSVYFYHDQLFHVNEEQWFLLLQTRRWLLSNCKVSDLALGVSTRIMHVLVRNEMLQPAIRNFLTKPTLLFGDISSFPTRNIDCYVPASEM